MKKILFVVMLAIALLAIPALGEEQSTPKPVTEGQQAQPEPKAPPRVVVVKTYTLRYVSPEFVKESLKMYFGNCSFSEGSNIITVSILKENLAEFEEQLKKLDVEKKNIMLRVFSVIASKEEKGDTIDNKDLKRVLSEISNLLSFKSYVLDGVSAISLKDGTRSGELLLSSSLAEKLEFFFSKVYILTNSSGKRSVTLKFALRQTANNQSSYLMESETEIAENGYLVAGVSRIGSDGRSLVLVINAEIK